MPEEDKVSDEQVIETITDEVASRLGGTIPTPEEKQNVHTFLTKVVTEKNTTKIGNLSIEELGMPKQTVRGYKEMALISDKIMQNTFFKEYFEQEAENVLATSLSKEGFLVRQATLTRKELADVTKPRTVNKGWFKKKEVPVNE